MIVYSELFILNSFGALEDETHVERTTCSEAGASCCFVNRDDSVVIEDETTSAAVDEVMRSKVTRSEIEPQANVSPSGEVPVKNQSTNPENPTKDHVLKANSKPIKDAGCLKSNAYEDQVADYRNSQRRRFNTSKKTLLVGDSMTKHICNQKVGRACRGLSKCYTYSGATVSTLETKLKSIMANESFSNLIIHVGTNDLVHKPAEAVAKNLEDLVMKFKGHTSNIAISSVIMRNDGRVNPEQIFSLNCIINQWCINNNVHFIDNSNINSTHLNRSNLHFNKVGDRVLGKNICAYLKLIRIGYVNPPRKELANSQSHFLYKQKKPMNKHSPLMKVNQSAR